MSGSVTPTIGRSIMDNDDDDEADYYNDDALAKEEEMRAHRRLIRASLYGGGSRARIPKVKHIQKESKSPYTINETKPLPEYKEVLHSAVPPGAHQDQFRLVRFPTSKTANDPDRVFYTTTSATDGISFAQYQPPWYYGRENVTKPADSNFIMAANRYGFRGSKEIKQRHRSSYGPPSQSRTDQTPDFLHEGDDVADEWVPPIQATKFNTINGMESPKLWPENAEFVTGYKKKKLPTASSYKRETTVCLKNRPQTTQGLTSLFNKTTEMDNIMRDHALMERSNTFQSLPMTTQSMFETTWNDRVKKSASDMLRATLSIEKQPYEAHTLMDQSDTLHYSGSTAFIVHTQTTDEVKFRLRMEKTKSNIPYELRWKQVIVQFKYLKSKIKKDQSLTAAITTLAQGLKREALNIGTSSSFTRAEFIAAMTKQKHFEVVVHKQLGLLFSVFDPLKKNIIKFYEFIVLFAILDNPQDSVWDKLGTVYRLNQEYGLDQPPFDYALMSLVSCCISDKERLLMEKLFKESFRPMCYKLAINATTGNSSAKIVSNIHKSSGVNIYDKYSKDKDEKTKLAEEKAAREAEEIAKKERFEKSKLGGIPLVYNVCNHYLNQFTFIDVLKKCPEIVELFDSQLSDRLIQCYGSDTRKEIKEDNDPLLNASKDFTWILKEKKVQPWASKSYGK